MKFNIKDVKTWKDRHDVKVGDIGYVSNDLDILRNDLKSGIAQIKIICHVRDNDTDCFAAKASGIIKNYGFFLPSEAVKADKPKEKKYRPIKSLFELAIAFYGVPNYFQHISMGGDLFVKYKNDKNYKRVLITSLEFDENHALSTINGITLRAWFDHYELRNDKGEWVPFGVEVEEDE